MLRSSGDGTSENSVGEKPTQVVLNFWDFGGQERERVIHTFFFSPWALYLLVWNAREGEQLSAVRDWLLHIRHRVGEQARVLLVGTHGERLGDLNLRRLRDEFGDLLLDTDSARLLVVENSDGRGIDAVLERISEHVHKLPQIRQFMSPAGTQVREDLRRLRQATPEQGGKLWIRRSEFKQLCEQHSLEPWRVNTLIQVLHNVGDLIAYDDLDLRDIVVLQPDWLAKAISYVLEDGPTQTAGGELDHARLDEIWRSVHAGRTHYPAEHDRFFLRLMDEFDVAYRLQREDRSLVAQLLPQQPPEESPWNGGGTGHFDDGRRVTVLCRLDKVPIGLMPSLIVRWQRYGTGWRWRDGVVLERRARPDSNGPAQARALVELDDERTLRLEVRGPLPDRLAPVLQEGLMELLADRWKGLGYELLLPCEGAHGERRCPDSFPVESVEEFSQDGEKLRCPRCRTWNDPRELLLGVSMPSVTSRTVEGMSTALSTRMDGLSRQMEGVARQVHEVGTRQDERLVALTHGQGESLSTLTEIREAMRSLPGEVTAELENTMREFLRAFDGAGRDCPRLFGVERAMAASVRDRAQAVTNERFLLRLYCEYPGEPHVVGEPYGVNQARTWWARTAPYLWAAAKLLKIAAPMAGGAIELLAGGEDELKQSGAKPWLSMATGAAGQFPGDQEDRDAGQIDRLRDEGGSAEDGLRALRALLFELDPQGVRERSFQGLRVVRLRESYLPAWMCDAHATEEAGPHRLELDKPR